jgi:hypothetical protein
MELSELNQDERIALVGLMSMVVMSDRNASEEEREDVYELAEAFGADGYQKAMDAFEERFQDVKGFQTFLRGIKREDARDLIFATVLDAAEAEGIEGQEAEILDWLAKAWNIEIEVPEGAEGEGEDEDA